MIPMGVWLGPGWPDDGGAAPMLCWTSLSTAVSPNASDSESNDSGAFLKGPVIGLDDCALDAKIPRPTRGPGDPQVFRT